MSLVSLHSSHILKMSGVLMKIIPNSTVFRIATEQSFKTTNRAVSLFNFNSSRPKTTGSPCNTKKAINLLHVRATSASSCRDCGMYRADIVEKLLPFAPCKSEVQRYIHTSFPLRDDEEKTNGKEKTSSSKIKDKIEELAEDIKTIPNFLTMSRVVLAPVCGYLVLDGNFTMATGLFVFAGLTDLLDGHIARTYPSQSSVLGSVIDPLADKFLVTILTVTLTMVDLIPIGLTGLIIFRDIGLIAGSAYMRYISLPGPKTFARFFDISILTFTVQPTFISKVNTGVQLLLLASSVAAPVFGYVDHVYLHYLWYLTAATTVMSGFSYMFAKDAIQLMKKYKQ